MKALFGLSLVLSAFVSHSSAQDTALLSAVGALPHCALQCLTAGIAQSPCELTDQTCICTNAPLQSGVESCVLQSCTVKESLTTKNITTSICNAPIHNQAPQMKAINISLSVLSNLFVLARIAYKVFAARSDLGRDDYAIVVALFVGMSSAIIIDRGALENGLGKDIWTLDFSQITSFIKFFYMMEILYFAQVALLKLSLLLFYERIFPSTIVKKVIWATIIFNILYGIAFVLTAIFQCHPIPFYWNSWDKEDHGGKCIDINALGWSNAVISIVLDFWMLAIPLSQIIHLKMAWKKKVGVALMFCVGTFVTVVSILRLHSLVHFAKSSNPTADEWDTIRWSTVEINIGIICTCMPAVRVILSRILPKAFGSTNNSSDRYHMKGTVASIGSSGTPRREKGVASFLESVKGRSRDPDDEEELVDMRISSRTLPSGKVADHGEATS